MRLLSFFLLLLLSGCSDMDHTFECSGVLIKRTYFPATVGTPSDYITEWDCGKYGILLSYSPEIFRCAKDKPVITTVCIRRRTPMIVIGIKDNE